MAIQMTDPCPKQPVTPGETTNDQLDNSPIEKPTYPKPPPAGSTAGVTVGANAGPDTADGAVGEIEVRDHRSSNPATWTKEQWMEAIKENPEHYGSLFIEMSARGELPAEVTTAEMNLFVSDQLQKFNRAITMLHDLMNARHETLKESARIRV